MADQQAGGVNQVKESQAKVEAEKSETQKNELNISVSEQPGRSCDGKK